MLVNLSYIWSLVLLSVQRFVCSRLTLDISWKVCFLVSRVQNGSADKVLMKSCHTRTARVQPVERQIRDFDSSCQHFWRRV